MSLRSVRVETQKWPDQPHWEFDAVRLGADQHGIWVGVRRGTLLSKPTRAFQAAADHVVLVPHDEWWLGTFYGSDLERPFDVYVDIATPAEWHGEDLVQTIDLDLDVARRPGEDAFIDDQDEFSEHQVSLGYPPEVIQNAELTADRILAAVTSHEPPFDGVHLDWLARLRHRLQHS
ncbi:MAG TPA: DUF402 domain-containing protein [Marmoricola sp.]|nr:DUF402 domain-containing protein [Marmoricola sp.]HNI70382.1 DUF402 domain-containing protein [Marmoricola sp.]HNJ77938.1 DUF402 domain-containing protein [Marmoricola sp.]HNN47762.1 DUF402 domain-containing protein [Marmoricola sp.]HNO39996.1 DUF402 domain-containing protein [Marmoricola sp.]